MARIILVTGGVRSGKSSFAEQLMLIEEAVTYLATCPNIDNEMNDRIVAHCQRRASFGWHTIEEEIAISRVLAHKPEGSFLVECLTLWVNNLMYKSTIEGRNFTEEDMADICQEVLLSVQACEGTILFVTNETGLGIMPENKEARRFGDLAGRCNQIFAEAASEVYFMVSGIAQKIKG
jgi:adenosylcobinamide kinase/adenosylcobinamide-phosphate guanylyltransferase